MPNGRWTNQQIGTVRIKSTYVAVVDPESLAGRIGIDADEMKTAIRELVNSGEAVQWSVVSHSYRVFQQQHDDGDVTWSFSS